MHRLVALALAAFAAPPAAAQQRPRLDPGAYASFRYEAGDGADDGLALRRFVVNADARWSGRLRAYAEVAYEPSSGGGGEPAVESPDGGITFAARRPGASGFALEQAWAELRLGPVGARLGAVLAPLGRINLEHDDHLASFPRRPLVGRGAGVLPAPAAWTELGLGLVAAHDVGARGVLSWQAFLVNGVTLDHTFERRVSTRTGASRERVEVVVSPTQGALGGSHAADALVGRVAFAPGPGSELGLSAYGGRYTPDFLGVDARLRSFGVDGRARFGPLVAEGEFLSTRYARVDAVVTDFASVVREQATRAPLEPSSASGTEVAITLTGLADRRSGLLLEVSAPIALPPGAFGLEAAGFAPAARYEHVWLDRDLRELAFAAGRVTRLVQSDREQHRLALGVAFRPVPAAVVQLAYERNHAIVGPMIDPDGGPRTTDALVLGLAVGF